MAIIPRVSDDFKRTINAALKGNGGSATVASHNFGEKFWSDFFVKPKNSSAVIARLPADFGFDQRGA